MKLTSLARSKSEQKTKSDCMPSIGYDKYGYGTRIRLDKDDLEKLGVKVSDFEVGSKFDVEAIAEVISVSQNKGSEYESSSVELQITKLGLEKRTSGGLDAIEKGLKDADEA